MKKAKLFGKILFYIVFFAVLLLVVGMMIAKFSNKVFFFGDRAMIWVMTDSMEDEIPEKSYIQIRKIDPVDIKSGDVITFYSDDPALMGHLNTHRVVEIVDDGKAFVTKGDNNFTEDKYHARAESVIGVYEKNLTVMSAIGRVLQSRTGLIIVFVLMALLIVYSFASDYLKNIFKKTQKDSSSDE